MSKGSKQTTNQQATQNSTASTAIDPVVQQDAYNVLNQASQTADNYNPVMQQAPVDFNQNQLNGQALQVQAGMNNAGGDTLNSAIGAASGAANFQPLAVGGQGYNAAKFGPVAQASSQGYDAALAQGPQGYTAQNAQGAKIDPNAIQNVSGPNSAAQLQSYLSSVSPQFQQSVIQPALDAINEQRIQALQGTDAQAAQAGAFGGDRQAIYDAETNRQYANQAGQLAGSLGLQGFNAATGLLQNDQGLGQQAALANQSANLNAATNNANFAQQAGLANQGAQNQAAQYGADQANNFTLQNANFQNQAAQFGANAANNANLANAGAENSASALNQASQNAAGQFGASAANTANLANQSAGLAGAGLNLQGAGALAGMSDQQRNNAFGNAAAIQQVGAQQQAQDQSAQDVAYQNAVAQNNAGLNQVAIKQQALGVTPYGTTQTTNGSSSGSGTTTQTMLPGSAIASGIGTAAGIAGLFASDRRLKTNIQPMNGTGSALDKVRKMKGVSYNWKGSRQPNLGLVAQDVERAMPAGVKTINGVKHVDGPAVMGLLVDAVNQLHRKVARA